MTPRLQRIRARLASVAALLMFLVAPPTYVLAQEASTLSGRVVDAGSGRPVADVTVTIEPAAGGLIPDVTVGNLVPARTVVTGASGLYRFTDLGIGTYRLRIERIGYRAATLEVEILRPAATGVSVALELDPIALEPMIIEQRAASPFQRASNADGELDAARMSAELDRQAQFLSSDTRVLTYADVMDGVTLGEGDVFRALQRFAGVGTRDDYTAELWTRGAPWTQTRVTFDGVPLFNPVHAVGVLSAIAPEVLGSANFHPGVAPPSLGDGAAGAVDMRTRSGSGNGELRGVADVSMASTKLVFDQRIRDRVAWLVAARRSHLDVMTGGLDWMGLDTLDLPYVFHDIAARIDIEPSSAFRIEASGLWEEDRLEGDVEGVLEQTDAHWGNTAGRVTIRGETNGFAWSQSVGASRFDARTEERIVRTRDQVPAWTEPAMHNALDYVHVTGEISQIGDPVGRTAAGVNARAIGARWSVGYDVSWQDINYDGSYPRYHAVQPDTARRLTYARSLMVTGLWANMRLALGSRARLDAGLRLETGGTIANAGIVRPAPRVALRLDASENQSFSVSAGRTWQHAQSIALAGPSIHPAFHATHFWLLAGERTPAIRSDIVNIGTERWLGDGWLASANAWARRSTGLTLPDPRPGRLGRRGLFVHGDSRAHGIETTLRRIGASWSTSFGYTYGVANIAIAGNTYPSSADRRHVFDAMAGVRVWRGLRTSAAFTSMTGAPFTRAYSRSPQDCTSFGFGCEDPTGSYIEAHNGERTPGYQSLDVSLLWSQQFGPVETSAYVQVRNVLARDNASTYAGSGPIGRVVDAETDRIIWQDRFEAGLPRMPMVGFRLTF